MSLSSVSVSKSKQLIYPSSEMHPSLEPNLLLLGNGLIVDELKSTVRGKIKQLKSDLVESGEKLDYERQLRDEAEKRARYFEQKAHLVNMYDTDYKSDPGVKKELSDRLSPLKRRKIKSPKGFSAGGYETGDSRYFSDPFYSEDGGRSLKSGVASPNLRRDKQSESDQFLTTEGETTDFDGKFGRERMRVLKNSNSRSAAARRPTFDSDTDGYVGGPPLARSKYSSGKQLRRLSEERSASDHNSEKSSKGVKSADIDAMERKLLRSEDKIEAMKHELTALQAEKYELAGLLSELSELELDGKFRDANADSKNLRLMQELKDEEIDSKVASRVADIIEEIHVGQKKRDEALLNQMRETRSDRENLLKQIHDLQKQTQFLRKRPDERLEGLVHDDSDPSVEVLLEKIENASNGFEVEQAGAILLEKVIDTQKSANQIRDEEIAFLLQERNEALDKLTEFETNFFSIDKFGGDKDKAPMVQEERVNRALKMELQIAAQTRDDALSKAEAIEQELNSLKDYLAKTGLGSDQSLGEMEHQFVGGMDPKLDYLEQVAQANSEKLKQTEVERDAATEAAIKNEKTAKDLQMRNEQLERLVAVLRKKLGASAPNSNMEPPMTSSTVAPPPVATTGAMSSYSQEDHASERNANKPSMYMPSSMGGAMALEPEDPKSHAMPPFLPSSNSFMQPPDFNLSSHGVMGYDPSGYDSFAAPELSQKAHMGKPLPQMLDNLPADYYYAQHID